MLSSGALTALIALGGCGGDAGSGGGSFNGGSGSFGNILSDILGGNRVAASLVEASSPADFSNSYAGGGVQSFDLSGGKEYAILDVPGGQHFTIDKNTSGYHLAVNQAESSSSASVTVDTGALFYYDLYSAYAKGNIINKGTLHGTHMFIDKGAKFTNTGTFAFKPRISFNYNKLEFMKGVEFSRANGREYTNTLQVWGDLESSQELSFEPNQLLSAQGNLDASIVIDGGNIEVSGDRPGYVKKLTMKDGKGNPYFYANLNMNNPTVPMLKVEDCVFSPNSKIFSYVYHAAHPSAGFVDYVLVEASNSLTVPPQALTNAKIPENSASGSKYEVVGNKLVLKFKVEIPQNAHITAPTTPTNGNDEVRIGGLLSFSFGLSGLLGEFLAADMGTPAIVPKNKAPLGAYGFVKVGGASQIKGFFYKSSLGDVTLQANQGLFYSTNALDKSYKFTVGRLNVSWGAMARSYDETLYTFNHVKLGYAQNILSWLQAGVNCYRVWEKVAPENVANGFAITTQATKLIGDKNRHRLALATMWGLFEDFALTKAPHSSTLILPHECPPPKPQDQTYPYQTFWGMAADYHYSFQNLQTHLYLSVTSSAVGAFGVRFELGL